MPSNTSLQLLANSRSQNFSRFDLVPQTDVGFSVISSSSNNYPFDEYLIEGTFELIGATGPLLSHTYLLANVDQWTVDAKLDETGSDGQSLAVIVSLKFKRNQIIQFFAIFIGCLMWILSASILVLASSIWIRHRKVSF